MRGALALAPLALLSGCVRLPPELLPLAHDPAADAAGFKDLDAGAHLEPSLRFLVKDYDPARAQAVSALAEEDYERVMVHTGLFSFRPKGLYPIYIYKDDDEFHAKTGMPAWSGGAAVGSSIYTYEGPELQRTLAHEITHLIFHEYTGGGGSWRWLNEGLAVYEELQVATPAEKREIEAWLEDSRNHPFPFAAMTASGPGEQVPVRQWYGQSASVVRFLVETGGRGGIARALEAGGSLDSALAKAFPTLCDGLSSLERRWLLH